MARASGANVVASSTGESASTDDADHTVYVTGRKAETSSRASQRFVEGSLLQTFEGPEGSTSVDMKARAAEVAMDGSWVRFFDDGGYLSVRQESDRGSLREVSVTADREGDPRYVYRVDGSEKEWCSDAERVIAASWMGKKAYEGWAPALETSRSQGGSSSRSESSGRVPRWSTHLEWSANTSNSTSEDGVERRLRMVARGFHYNPDTGEIHIEPNGILEIDETVDNRRRSFTLTAGTANWSGEWEGRGKDLPQQWLRRILESNSSLPSSVIETITYR